MNEPSERRYPGGALWASFLATLAALAVLLALAALQPRRAVFDPRGLWVRGGDTLVLNGDTSGMLNRQSFRATRRGNRMCLALPLADGCSVLTLTRDSLVLTTGIATLLHPGDTTRVFRR